MYTYICVYINDIYIMYVKAFNTYYIFVGALRSALIKPLTDYDAEIASTKVNTAN